MMAPRCECGQSARMDPLGYWVCRTTGCDGYGQVLRYGTDSERAAACANPGCGRLITDPIHDPREDGPFEACRPRGAPRF